MAAYTAAALLYGRDAGLVAGLAAIWLTVLIRKVVTGSVPGLLTISAVVLASGELWLFLLQVPLANLAMCVLFARTASGPDPLIARLAAEVVALRQPATRDPGLHRFFQRATWLWAGIFPFHARCPGQRPEYLRQPRGCTGRAWPHTMASWGDSRDSRPPPPSSHRRNHD